MVHGYCDNDGCACRAVRVLVKLYDERQPFTAKTTWYCPRCQRALSHVRYQTLAEYEAAEARDARSSVNAQRWWRDHPGALAIPASALLDERLPRDAGWSGDD
jgi:hypothetical protein